jgi:probable rRNA maturation factor
MERDDAARRIDDSLVLSVAYEPPEALADTLFGLDDAALRHVVALTLARVGVEEPVELSLLVTGDDGLRTLNREYRGRDEATDVLSFPLLDEPLVNAPADQLWQPLETVVSADYEDDYEDSDIFDNEAAALADLPLGEEAGASVAGANGAGEGPEGADPDLVTGSGLHLGDIALSRDAIARQAAEAGHSAAWEAAYLVSHGVLHLVGYDDHTDAGYRAMVAHQEAVLASAGISL